MHTDYRWAWELLLSSSSIIMCCSLSLEAALPSKVLPWEAPVSLLPPHIHLITCLGAREDAAPSWPLTSGATEHFRNCSLCGLGGCGGHKHREHKQPVTTSKWVMWAVAATVWLKTFPQPGWRRWEKKWHSCGEEKWVLKWADVSPVSKKNPKRKKPKIILARLQKGIRADSTFGKKECWIYLCQYFLWVPKGSGMSGQAAGER